MTSKRRQRSGRRQSPSNAAASSSGMKVTEEAGPVTSGRNNNDVSTISDTILQHIMSQFPESNYTFAYGSAAIQQKGQARASMIDLVFVVDDPLEWHRENLKLNASHYSSLRWLGAQTICNIQEQVACGVYYNTWADVDDWYVKYGVISTSAMEEDLCNWSFLYVAGRLHKPIRTVSCAIESRIPSLITRNRISALRAALLLLPQTVTKFELYYAITELSYLGDFRMIIGENPNKVQNIISSNITLFDLIYIPIIEKLFPLVQMTTDDIVVQDVGPETRLTHLLHLPPNLQQHIARQFGRTYTYSPFSSALNIEEIMSQAAGHPDLPSYVRDGIRQLVWVSSIRQTFTGFLSTGVYGSIKYALEKLRKCFGSYWSQ